jgi:hypothetical protein
MSNYIVKAKKAYLKTPLTASATSVVLRAFVDSKDNELALSDFGSYGVVVIKQGDTIEMIKFDGVTQDGSSDACTLTVATNGRNLDATTPYAGSSTGNAFQSGAECIITNDPLTVSNLQLNNANTWALLQTFTVMPKSSDVPTEADDLINKTYADALVLGTLTTLNVVVPATAGETVTAGALLYFDTTDDEWKLADADTASTVENVMLAISQGAGVNGGAITGGVLLRGMDANQTGMTIGDIMYAGNTAGVISSSAGTNQVSVGVAKSATELYFSPRFDQQLTEDQKDALAGNLTTPSSANKFVTQAGLQKGAEIYGADAEASDTYVITLSPVPASYYTGMVIHFTANTANTGACTLNVNSLGAKSIKKFGGSGVQDLVTGDIQATQTISIVFDTANDCFILLGASPISATDATDLTDGGDTALHYHAGKNGVFSRDLSSASGAVNIAHGLGRAPKFIRITCMNIETGYVLPHYGVYNGTTQSCVYNLDDNTGGASYSGSANGFIAYTGATGGNPSEYSQKAVASFDATNIILTWTKTGSPTGTAYYVWEAF